MTEFLFGCLSLLLLVVRGGFSVCQKLSHVSPLEKLFTSHNILFLVISVVVAENHRTQSVEISSNPLSSGHREGCWRAEPGSLLQLMKILGLVVQERLVFGPKQHFCAQVCGDQRALRIFPGITSRLGLPSGLPR